MTRTDMANLLALVVDPDADDALLVPQLGRRGNDLTLPQPPLRLPGGSGQQLPRAVDTVMGPGLRTPVGGSGAFTASLDTREDDDDDDDASEVGAILCSGGCDVQCQCASKRVGTFTRVRLHAPRRCCQIVGVCAQQQAWGPLIRSVCDDHMGCVLHALTDRGLHTTQAA